jgi:hypothetical protein
VPHQSACAIKRGPCRLSPEDWPSIGIGRTGKAVFKPGKYGHPAFIPFPHDCSKGIETPVLRILNRKAMAFHHPAGESRQTPIPDSWKYCVETMFLKEVKGFSNTD